MKQLKQYTIFGIFFVLILGVLAHFLYNLTGNNPIVGFFTPINESIWEHMKLLFFPMLLYSLIIISKSNNFCIISSLCFGIFVGTLCIPIFFYTYTSILGKDIFILDIATFILSTIIAFFIFYKFALSCKLKPYTFLFYGFVCIFFLCFLLFTYNPPDTKIFEDPTTSSIYCQHRT